MRRRKGFTLVELLAVTAIIAILASILFTVMASAKVKSYEAVDIAQMRQIYVAVSMYEEQHNDEAPVNLQTLVPNYVSDSRIYRSPIDPVHSPRPPHRDYPAELFIGYARSSRVPYRISYGYLREYEPYNHDSLKWHELRQLPQVGMLAAPFYGTCGEWYLDEGPACDGSILRINMDGSFYRSRRRFPGAWGAVQDYFYFR